MTNTNVVKFTVMSWAVIAMILYLLASFIAADFSMMQWDPFGRTIIAIMWLVGCGITTMIAAAYIVEKTEKENNLKNKMR